VVSPEQEIELLGLTPLGTFHTAISLIADSRHPG